MKSFVHLHVHSYYSILDGMSSISGLVDRSIELGMNAVALTDHGNMFGIKEFYNCAEKKNKNFLKEIESLEKELKKDISEEKKAEVKADIEKVQKQMFKPILGCEVYVARRGRFMKESPEDRSGYHLVLLAKNHTGYRNLSRLVTLGWTEGFYYHPRIDHEILEKYSEGIIALSACLGGEIHKKIEAGDVAAAEEAVLWHKKVFGDDYYIELQLHQTDKPNADTSTYEKQKVQNEDLIRIARSTNTKLVASNDVHFLEERHADGHERLIALSTGKLLDDPTRMRYSKQEYLKSPQEMWAIFGDIPEALENSLEIADKIEHYSINSPAMMPIFPIPEDFATEEEYAKKFTEEQLREEFGETFDTMGGFDKIIRIKLEADYLRKLTYDGAVLRYGEDLSDEVKERLDFELDVMKSMGYPGYFLIVQDFIAAAREMGVSVGPGRGSAAGSLVAYCLKITNVDPIKYDLLFERFLNPDRISMPDIDIDFDDDGRGMVLRWVKEKYGKDRVAHIITYGTMATKSAIKDVARVQDLPLAEAERLTKLIPDRLPEDSKGRSPKVNIRNSIKHITDLQLARNSTDQNLSDTLKYAEMLEGTVRQTGVHACGVIIGSDDLINQIPLSTAKDKDTDEEILVTQYEGNKIEEVGMIKMDFLGLKTLSIIKEALSNIKKSHGIDIDIDNIPLDDEKTYELFSNGQTVGTFQFESQGMQKYLKELKPTQFEDLIAMSALYRPGPMQYIPSFINRKHGNEKIDYYFPQMESRLKETYGITVYQEQVMLLSRDIAGFTRGESDELRKVMGKKLADEMAPLKEKFMTGAKKNGYTDKALLEKIWSDWEEFANYAFNKSHATCYSLIAYQTAYLKAHYPAEFLAANLTRHKDNISDVEKFMDECRSMGMHVLGPDINESDLNFTVNQDGNIRFGLGGIKSVGGGAVEAIVKERDRNGKYTSALDFFERVNLTACNKRAVESLVYAGAFDAFPEISREQFFAENKQGEVVLESIIRYGNRFQLDNESNQNTLFGDMAEVEILKPEVPYAPEWSPLEKLKKEREYIGMFLSAHPLDDYEFEMKYLCNANTSDLKNLEGKEGRSFRVGGMITAIRHGTTRNGKPYGVFSIEDYEGAYEFPLFRNNYVEFSKYMIKDLYVMMQVLVQEKVSFGYQAPRDPNLPKELELRIRKIEMLDEVRDQMVEKLTLSIPLDQLDKELSTSLIEIINKTPGRTNIYFDIIDMEAQERLKLFARKNRISMTNDFYNFLKRYKEEGRLDFIIN